MVDNDMLSCAVQISNTSVFQRTGKSAKTDQSGKNLSQGFFKINYYYCYYYFGCIGSWLLLCRLFSSCGEWGLLFAAVCRLLIAMASLVAEHRLQGAWASVLNCSKWAQQLQLWALEHRLNSCNAWAQLICGMWDIP